MRVWTLELHRRFYRLSFYSKGLRGLWQPMPDKSVGAWKLVPTAPSMPAKN
jgi:hypothetical protein